LRPKVLHINFSSFKGGAARAVYRLNSSLNQSNLFLSKVLSVDQNKKIKNYIFFLNSQRFLNFFKRICIFFIHILEKYNYKIQSHLSYNYFNCNFLLKFINSNADFDIVHLHWINGEMLSIEDIGNIKKPIVWTFHDMWPFSGAEHVSIEQNRWINGYKIKSFFDFSAKTWLRKRENFKNTIQVIAPSSWIKNCVTIAKLTKKWPVTVIPNTIDTRIWKVKNKKTLRNKLQINKDAKIIMFSALGGGNEYHKGKDLLIKALRSLKKKINFEIIIVGENYSSSLSALGIKTHYLGHIDNDNFLSNIYNCTDVCVVPSRVESFSLTALEAQSCGTPVVSFNVCGLKDIIINNKTGFLAKPFSYKDLEKKILLILSNKKKVKLMRRNARRHILKNFSYPVVAKLYSDLYSKVIRNKDA
jgi:glycosyltransferase involved in cell wall biosynthesis